MTHALSRRVTVVLVALVTAAAVAAVPVASALATSSAVEATGSAPLAAQSTPTTLTVSVANDTGRVERGLVTVEGTSNREDETTIFVELVGANGSVVRSAEGEVDGRTGTWNVTLDLRDVPLGTYTLRADDSDVADEVTVDVVDSVATPTEDPTATPTEDPTATPTTTPTETPGFGLVVALVAFALSSLALARRRR